MDILEASVVVIALSAGAFVLAVWIVLVRVLPLLRRMEILAADAATTLYRLNSIAADLEGVVRDARRLELRVSNTAGVLLDQIEPPVRLVSALLAGTRTGLGSLLGSWGSRAVAGGRKKGADNRPERSS
jgi:hypothetical protein